MSGHEKQSDVPVTHDADAHRFEVTVDGEVAGYLEYDHVPAGTAAGKDSMVVMHTVVQPRHEGQGYASALARNALDHARTERMTVIPECSFVRGYVKRHEEYRDLLP